MAANPKHLKQQFCEVFQLEEPSEQQNLALRRAEKLAQCDPQVAIAALLLGMTNVPVDGPQETALEPKGGEPVDEPVDPDDGDTQGNAAADDGEPTEQPPDQEPDQGALAISSSPIPEQYHDELTEAGLKTVQDVLDHEDLTQINGIGPKSQEEILDSLK